MINSCLILISVFLFSSCLDFAQNKIDFHSPENIKQFGDHLFCEKDYLRAYDEYANYLAYVNDDTVRFKSALVLQRIGSFDDALKQFSDIPSCSNLFRDSKEEYFRTLFLKKDFSALKNIFIGYDSTKTGYSFLNKLNKLSLLYSEENMPPEKDFIKPFQQNLMIKKFYEWKTNPPYKSPLLAGVLATVVPGLGKVYTENYTDGLFAALLTGVLGYVAYTDFKADHNVRGWIFTGVAAFFYAGSIYGSVASAQIYNARIKFNFESDLHDFLEAFNYLSRVYNFCK